MFEFEFNLREVFKAEEIIPTSRIRKTICAICQSVKKLESSILNTEMSLKL